MAEVEEDVALDFDFELAAEANSRAFGAGFEQHQSQAGDSSGPPALQQNGVHGLGSGGGGRFGTGRKNFRQTVCRHWLRGLCMKGSECGFLHQYDKARMPVCRFFAKWGECREPDCIYKHSFEDIKECHMYKLGFCPNGPDCRYRHERLPGPPPSPEHHLPKLQPPYHNYHRPHTSSGGGGPEPRPANRLRQQSPPPGGGGPGHDLGPAHSVKEGPSHLRRPPAGAAQAAPSTPQLQEPSAAGGLVHQSPLGGGASESHPLPPGVSRYFVVKSNNADNLELSVQRGMWATHRNNEAKLNEAIDTCDNVLLLFSVNETRHFQGCARMMTRIGASVGGGGWKHSNGSIVQYGRNFRVKWLKLCQLSFNSTRLLRNPYNENLPVKISRDCQELEPSVGAQLAALLYSEPDSPLMAGARAAERRAEVDQRAAPQNGALGTRAEPGGGSLGTAAPGGGSHQRAAGADEDDDEDDSEDEEDDEEVGSRPANGGAPPGGGRGGPNAGMGPAWRGSSSVPPGTGGRGFPPGGGGPPGSFGFHPGEEFRGPRFRPGELAPPPFGLPHGGPGFLPQGVGMFPGRQDFPPGLPRGLPGPFGPGRFGPGPFGPGGPHPGAMGGPHRPAPMGPMHGGGMMGPIRGPPMGALGFGVGGEPGRPLFGGGDMGLNNMGLNSVPGGSFMGPHGPMMAPWGQEQRPNSSGGISGRGEKRRRVEALPAGARTGPARGRSRSGSAGVPAVRVRGEEGGGGGSGGGGTTEAGLAGRPSANERTPGGSAAQEEAAPFGGPLRRLDSGQLRRGRDTAEEEGEENEEGVEEEWEAAGFGQSGAPDEEEEEETIVALE